jgi:hypothetical protein
MKKLFISCAVLLILMTVFSTGCSAIFHTSGSSQIVDKTYDFNDFTNINISSAFQYQITQSDTYSVVVTTNESMFAHLDIHQSGNTLYIGMKPFLFNNSNPKVTITLPQLNKISISGDCQGSATGFVAKNDLEINLSGASRMDADFEAGSTKMDISGDSNITGDLTSTDIWVGLSGASHFNMTLTTGKTNINASGDSDVRGSLNAGDCQITLEGASTCELTGSAGNSVISAGGDSNFNSPELTLQSADVKLTGASRATFRTDGTMNVDINGDSTLNYYGNPSFGKIAISGDSRLNHK